MKRLIYRINRRAISFMISDIFFMILSLAVSGYIFKSLEKGIEIGYGTYLNQMSKYIPEGILFLLLFLTVNYVFGLYSSMWKYAGATEIITLFIVLVLEFTALMFMSRALDIQIPLYTFPMSVLICFFLMTISRMWYRMVIRSKQILFANTHGSTLKRVMIVGVGDAGAMIVRSMTHDPKKRGLPVVLVDDDPAKQKMKLLGVPIAGNRYDIPDLAKAYAIDRIIIAIPSINTKQLKELLDICVNTKCEVLKSDIAEMFNNTLDSASGKGDASNDSFLPAIKLEAIKPEDLLGRDAIDMDIDAVALYLTDKTILISGGAGSIGSEICRQACRLNPKHIIIYDIDENNSYSLNFEIPRKYPKQKITIVIGSIRDEEKLYDTFQKYRPDVVFHAAAHKHVPLMENDPEEAIKNNVFGTFNLCKAALDSGVKKFILISTDKAVNPTNVMGASKRMCEYIIKGMNDRVKTMQSEDPSSANTIFAAVRFGNVLGSNGSVVPLFKKQLADGGPITITDKRMTRYFMIIPEAAKLVIEAGAMAKGGEIFILDMGTPIKIDDMARNMIRLAGLEPDVDIRIEYIGLRPGEKLYEELTMDYENIEKTKQSKINVAKDDFMTYSKLETRLEILQVAIKDKTNIREAIKAVVPTYISECEG
ncbi:MAG: polysaccharide biosynthesis protein [Saccharofermentanales bacterium]